MIWIKIIVFAIIWFIVFFEILEYFYRNREIELSYICMFLFLKYPFSFFAELAILQTNFAYFWLILQLKLRRILFQCLVFHCQMVTVDIYTLLQNEMKFKSPILITTDLMELISCSQSQGAQISITAWIWFASIRVC